MARPHAFLSDGCFLSYLGFHLDGVTCLVGLAVGAPPGAKLRPSPTFSKLVSASLSGQLGGTQAPGGVAWVDPSGNVTGLGTIPGAGGVAHPGAGVTHVERGSSPVQSVRHRGFTSHGNHAWSGGVYAGLRWPDCRACDWKVSQSKMLPCPAPQPVAAGLAGHAAAGGSVLAGGGASVAGGATGAAPSSGAVVAASSGASLTGIVSVGSAGF